ncbi:MAG: DUF3829 domain-containing protein [Myxococcales bacterium]|nr:DUF3829 domain-containing protein [Myxococcales bacterium]
MRTTRVLGPLVLALSVLIAGVGVAHAKPDPKQAKINVYVDILNNWSSYVYKQRSDYAAWVDLTKGPDCKASKARGPSAIGDTAKTTTFPGYLKALKKGPKLAVDAAATKMVTTLIALWQPTSEASEYYFKRQWKDDDCKRGLELHATLTALWDEYAAADRDVRGFVVAFNDEREVKQLATTTKKYGKKLRYHYERTIIDGKLLIRAIDLAMEATPIDGAAIDAQLAAFVEVFESATALVEGNRTNRKIYDVLYQGGYTQFLTRAGWYRDAVQRLTAKIADPKAKPEAIAKEHEAAIKAYNSMIDGANAVRLTASIK